MKKVFIYISIFTQSMFSVIAQGVFNTGDEQGLEIGKLDLPQDSLDVESQWVSVAPEGKLIYQTTPKGDRIMDFSSAGYMGGGVAFPNVTVKRTIRPLGNGGDDVAVIQATIDAVAALPLENGFRGAILLEPGTYNCSRTIRISANGIVLRGSGSEGQNASILLMNGEGRYAAVNISPIGYSGNALGVIASNTVRTTITDDYVPSGANSFLVSSTEGFTVGDIIQILRPTTAEWVKFMEMHNMVRGGAQTWIGLDRKSIHIRRIVAINGKNITLDAPLSDSYDTQYLGKGSVEVVRVAAHEPVMPLSQIGIEHLRIQCPSLETDYGNAPYSGVRIGNAQDIWVDDIQCVETMNTIPINGRRITIRNTHVTKTYANLGASKPADFSIEGSQILIDRCSSDAGNTYWVWTNSYNTGPNVVLNSCFSGRGSRIQPHQRWATGLLVDNCHTPDGGIDFSNRGVAGSGHGWCMGWGVAWNCTAATFIIQNPPGAPNWAIGCIGERQQTARYFEVEPVLSEGIFESHGTHVAPRSLYLAQLTARLGTQAVEAIGYAPGTPAALALEKPVMLTPCPQSKPPVDREFGENLAFLRPVNLNGQFLRSDTSDPRKYSGEKALDGNPSTYWMPGERNNSERGNINPNFEIDTEGPLVINTLVISEPDGITNVRAYKIEGLGGTEYSLLAEGTTIGERKVHSFPKTTVWKVRLTILRSEGTPAISELSIHYK